MIIDTWMNVSRSYLGLESLNKPLEGDYKKFCPMCTCPIQGYFKDELSEQEFAISGLCQGCQDDLFESTY